MHGRYTKRWLSIGRGFMRRKQRSQGVTLIELLLGLAVSAMLIVGVYVFFVSIGSSMENSKKRADLVQLADGIKKAAKFFIEMYAPYCIPSSPPSSSERMLQWGWLHSNCRNTKIFPDFNNNVLIYTYDVNAFPASEREQRVNAIKSEIRSYFSGFCIIDDSVNGQIRIVCLGFDRIFYCPFGVSDCNNVANLRTASVHVAGSSYDYILNRIAGLVVEYSEKGRLGEHVIHHRVGATAEHEKPAFLDFGDFYQEMFQRNMKKFLDVYNAVKKYEVTRRVAEMKNTAPAGLDEMSDYFVPWVYQLTASSQGNAFVLCNDASMSNCVNLQNNIYWNRGIEAWDMYAFLNNVISYFLGGDRSYWVDAWGNPLGLELLANLTNFSVCYELYNRSKGTSNCIRLSNPPYPQKDYDQVLTTVRPPYIGFIYSEFCVNLTNSQQSSCRIPIVYAN